MFVIIILTQLLATLRKRCAFQHNFKSPAPRPSSIPISSHNPSNSVTGNLSNSICIVLAACLMVFRIIALMVPLVFHLCYEVIVGIVPA